MKQQDRIIFAVSSGCRVRQAFSHQAFHGQDAPPYLLESSGPPLRAEQNADPLCTNSMLTLYSQLDIYALWIETNTPLRLRHSIEARLSTGTLYFGKDHQSVIFALQRKHLFEISMPMQCTMLTFSQLRP